MAKFKHGDIFSIRLSNGKYISGRIMLDVKKQCVLSKKIGSDSPLDFFNGTLLVDLYKNISDEPVFSLTEPLIPGIFILDTALKSGQWPIISYEGVDPKCVEFPETLANVQGRLCFQRGEVVLPFPTNASLHDNLEIYPTIHRPEKLPLISNYYLHLEGIIKHMNDEQMRDLKHCDLRFSNYRAEIYALLGEDEDESYYEISSRLGYDISRFY